LKYKKVVRRVAAPLTLHVKGSKIVSPPLNFMGIKISKILRRFQEYKLTLVTKCNAPKNAITKNMLNWYFSPKRQFFGIFFYGCKVSLYFSALDSASSDSHKAQIVGKDFNPYIVNGPKVVNQLLKRSLVPEFMERENPRISR
jgi:hypothetical protein